MYTLEARKTAYQKTFFYFNTFENVMNVNNRNQNPKLPKECYSMRMRLQNRARAASIMKDYHHLRMFGNDLVHFFSLSYL